MQATADLNEQGDRILVVFPYDPAAVKAIRSVPGARFIPKDKGGPAWQLPLDLTSGRLLREQFGEYLVLGARLKAWGNAAVQTETAKRAMGHAADAQLDLLTKKLPKLAKFLHPYQRADAAFLSQGNAINSNQPGLGKTVETIASVFEADREDGPQLVVAPKTSLDAVWVAELTRWQKLPVLTLSGDHKPEEREAIIAQATEWAAQDKAFWFVTNPAMVRYYRDKNAEKISERGKMVFPAKPVYPALFEISWNTLIVDEYHKQGLTNDKSLFSKAMRDMQADATILLSGTPMGGKPIKLWSALNLIDPGSFTSKWRWADQWLDVQETEAINPDTGKPYGKVIHGIQSGREADFYSTHAPYLLRRTKTEVLPQLPPKQHVERWCKMTPTQAKQYQAMELNAELKIGEENLTATGILAEYTRLKQFADARAQVKHMANGDLKVLPTSDSGKLPHLLELLNERGIEGDADEAEGDEQVVVFSQYSGIVDMVHEWLTVQGIAAAKLTGATSQKERTRIVAEFQAKGGPRVLVMTTTAGGVAITLDKASTVVFMDETWDPDDQEQGEDRVHRASRIHQVTVYYLRSRGTIEEYIRSVTGGKRMTNDQILDVHRKRLAMLQEQAA